MYQISISNLVNFCKIWFIDFIFQYLLFYHHFSLRDTEEL